MAQFGKVSEIQGDIQFSTKKNENSGDLRSVACFAWICALCINNKKKFIRLRWLVMTCLSPSLFQFFVSFGVRCVKRNIFVSYVVFSLSFRVALTCVYCPCCLFHVFLFPSRILSLIFSHIYFIFFFARLIWSSVPLSICESYTFINTYLYCGCINNNLLMLTRTKKKPYGGYEQHQIKWSIWSSSS